MRLDKTICDFCQKVEETEINKPLQQTFISYLLNRQDTNSGYTIDICRFCFDQDVVVKFSNLKEVK